MRPLSCSARQICFVLLTVYPDIRSAVNRVAACVAGVKTECV